MDLIYYCPVCGEPLRYVNTLEDDFYICKNKHRFDDFTEKYVYNGKCSYCGSFVSIDY